MNLQLFVSQSFDAQLIGKVTVLIDEMVDNEVSPSWKATGTLTWDMKTSKSTKTKSALMKQNSRVGLFVWKKQDTRWHRLFP